MATNERIVLPRRVVVTGGNGFMGRAVMDHYRAQGVEVCGIDVRPDPRHDVVVGDIGDPVSWRRHLDATDLLVHTAALVSNNVAHERAWCVNVVGTRRVVEAAADAGVGRLVHVSTMGVARFAQARPDASERCLPGVGLDERWPLMSTGNPYTDTKIAGEHAVLAAHAAGEVDCTIVRPADVYGPGCRPWVLEPIAAMRSGRFVLPARGQGLFTPVYIDDLVDGIARAAAVPEAAGRIIQLGGENPVTTLEYFGYLARMPGRDDPPRHAPTPVAIAAAEVARLVARARGRHTELGRGVMQMLAKTRPVSNDLAHRLLGWWPQVALDEGMARVEAWLHREGVIDRRPSATPGAVDHRSRRDDEGPGSRVG